MPHRCAVATDAHLKQGFHNLEQTGQHFGGREIGFDFLLAEGVARFFEFFADVRPVPRLRVLQVEVFARKGAHLGHVFFGVRACAHRQITQEAHHFGRRLGHLGGQGDFGVVGVTQELRFFLAQRQNFFHPRCVVLFRFASLHRLRLVGRACGVGAVELLTQGRAVGELHDGQVARHFEAELVHGGSVTHLGRCV